MKGSVISAEKIPCIVLGKVVGMYDGWDQVSDTCICFYEFIPNDLGKKWLGIDQVKEDFILYFDYNSGDVQTDSSESPDNIVDFRPDWSVFNYDEPTKEEETALLKSL